MTIGTVLNRLKDVSGSQGRFKALCPVEPTHHIKVIESHGGRVYMKCLAHNEHQLVDAINLPLSAIFPDGYFFPDAPKAHPEKVYLEVQLDLIQMDRDSGKKLTEAEKKREMEIFKLLRQAK